jgi:hypothetical protein
MPCCDDIHKRVCFVCRDAILTRLLILAHNIAIGSALCNAYWDGVLDRSMDEYPGRWLDQH